MSTLWIPFALAVAFSALCFFAWILSLFESWQTRIVVVLGALTLGGLGWIRITMGAEMVVFALAGGGVVGLLIWLANELWESVASEREERRQEERSKRWVEEEKQARARRQEEQSRKWAEERRQEEARQAAEDKARRAREQHEAEVRRQNEERERQLAEVRQRKREAAKAENERLKKEADPDTPMF
jgi:hypothetical protein